MWSHGLWASIAAACIISLACGSNEAEPNEVSSSAPSGATTSTPPSSTAGDTASSEDEVALIGTYLRDVVGFEKKPPPAPEVENEWALHLRDYGVDERDDVLELYYLGREPGSSWGRAYEFSSDRETLHLGPATRPKDVKLRMGGFECRPDGPATYAWSTSDNYYKLQLMALTEPCAARRTILEGEWNFFD